MKRGARNLDEAEVTMGQRKVTVPTANSHPARDRQTDDITDVTRLDDLLRPEVLEAFDRTSFERDGYWVWEGILTNPGRMQWTASLQKLQKMSDDMVMDTDWAAIDFAGRGLKPLPPEKISPEFLATCIGGTGRN